jgi:DNA polymerase III alpha subunit (gram-positive type)
LEEVASGYAQLEPKHWDRAEKKALEVNGVDKKTWKASHKSTRDALKKMIDLVYKHFPPGEKIKPFGHNVKFDEDMLKPLFKEEGLDWIFHYHYADTMQWAMLWSLVTEETIYSFRLGDLCERFHIENKKEHDAIGDIRATIELSRAIINDLKARIRSGGQERLL